MLPAFVPKKERPFYRDAVSAWQAGKVLAALFYLRTFIGQFARRVTGLQGPKTGDEIMAAYSATLPSNLRDSMPSLGDWYEQLSVLLYEGRDDEVVFEKAMEAVTHHFDIRRVHKLSEKPPEGSKEPDASKPVTE